MDLEVLASSFQLRLTVIQLSCPPVTFGFGWSRRAELVVHEGLWAPMLGPSRFSYDSMCVPGTNILYELGRGSKGRDYLL